MIPSIALCMYRYRHYWDRDGCPMAMIFGRPLRMAFAYVAQAVRTTSYLFPFVDLVDVGNSLNVFSNQGLDKI
jgi:hypothetical protein